MNRSIGSMALTIAVAAGVLTMSTTAACRLDPGLPLVPATVAENPTLPSATIAVNGRECRIHVRELGRAGAPVLMVAPGSLSDVNPYLGFAAFADAYHVVLWDLRGNGLSERVPPSELLPSLMVEELHAVKQVFSPDDPVTIVGHSWSANFVAMYLGRYPQEAAQAILIEPIGLTSEDMESVPSVLNLTAGGYLDMAWLADTMSPITHELLDLRMLAVLSAGVRDFFIDREDPPPWPVQRVGGAALIVWERSIVDRRGVWDYNFTEGLDRFSGQCLLVGSSHSPIGADFQAAANERHFTNAQVLRIENSGHRIVTEQWQQLEDGLRAFLSEYGGAG